MKITDWREAALLLKSGEICVMPTDTIYGVCASAFNKKSVERVYKLKKRNLKKPAIVLIGDFDDFKKFGVVINKKQRKILKKLWPGKISVIFPCREKSFFYLHRGTKLLAFRLPKKRELLKILSVAGPLIASSANLEGRRPAENIGRAKTYFGKNVFYYGGGNLRGKSSTLVDLNKGIKILRIGADCNKIKKLSKSALIK